MPIKGLTDRPPRLPRIGKIHLGVKVTTNKEGQPCKPYPKATDYFVFDPTHPQYDELVQTYGEKTAELRILLPLEDETKFAQQFYRLYSMTRGLVCKGDGEKALRMVDTATGAVANRDTKEVDMREITCGGRECPEYGPRACGETMNLQFLLPEVSGFGVWQIDTGSINSIININSNVGPDGLVRAVYGRVSMVPLILALEPREVVNPDDGKKKTVRVLNLRSPDKMIEAYRKANMPPLELVQGMGMPEIGEIGDDDLPPAGDEPPFAELPVSEVGPDTDTDQWPGTAESEIPPTADIPVIGQWEPLPVGPPGASIKIRETGQILYWHGDGLAGRWREAPPDVPKQPITLDAPTASGVTQGAVTRQADPPDTTVGEVPATVGAFFKWMIDHGRKYTPTWFYKSFGFNKEDMQDEANIPKAYAEVKELMGW